MANSFRSQCSSLRSGRFLSGDGLGIFEVARNVWQMARPGSVLHLGVGVPEIAPERPRLRIDHYPSYAPELNPDEGVWSLAKRELANGCPHGIDELMNDAIHSIDDIERLPAKLRSCILRSDPPPFLPSIALFMHRLIEGDGNGGII
jgi:hypothetical protein